MADIACQKCGNRFKARRSDAKYCQECKPKDALDRGRRYEHRHRAPCPECGSPMVRGAALCRGCNNKAQPWRKEGEANSNWKGGRTESKGYVFLRVKREPGGAGGPYRAEHILVWEKGHGPLPKGWVVHHFNGIKDDNRPENLFGEPRKRHSPRQVVEPYQRRIIALEKQLASASKYVVASEKRRRRER